jgi:hypothetical protein
VESRSTQAENGPTAVLGTDRFPGVRRARGALGSIAWVALGLLLTPPGCLNPRPEEDPSFGEADNAPGPSTADPCENDPALASCPRAPVDTSDDGNGVDDADQEQGNPGGTSGPATDQPPTEDAGADAAAPDAGAASVAP